MSALGLTWGCRQEMSVYFYIYKDKKTPAALWFECYIYIYIYIYMCVCVCVCVCVWIRITRQEKHKLSFWRFELLHFGLLKLKRVQPSLDTDVYYT